MKHIMRFIGRLENNYENLQPNPIQYITKKGKSASVEPFPPNMDGIKFFGMEDMTSGKSIPKVVMVEDIKLPNPISIIYDRHSDGKKIGPSGVFFGDNSAKNLMSDISDRNPELKDKISRIYQEYFGSPIKNITPQKIKTSQDGTYLPTREDFDNFRRRCLRNGRERVSLKECLDMMEIELRRAERKLKGNWRVITEKNILSWAQ